MSEPFGVAILPDTTSARAEIVAAIAQVSGGSVVDGSSELLELVVIDWSHPDAASALARVRDGVPGRATWVIAVLPESETAVPDGVDDFVPRANLAAHLPTRLRLGALRRAARQQAWARDQDLALLLELTARFAAALDLRELLHDITRNLAERLGIFRLSLVVVDESDEEGIVVASSDDPKLDGLRIGLDRYPEIREAVRSGAPVRVENASSNSLFEGVLTEVASKGIRAILAVPVAVRGKVLGVLLVRASRKEGFHHREVDFWSTVAHATAIALRNAQLLESMRGETEREKSARIAAEERARMSDELRKTKEFLERLIDSSVDAIIAADLRGRIILFNPGAEAITGYSAAEAREHLDVRSLYPPGGARAVMAKLRSSDFGGVGKLSASREEILHRTGEKVPVSMTASLLYEGDRATASVGIFTDLRDRVQLERKLSDVEGRLEASERNAVIVALAGAAAHELNQPLTSVMGYAELLERKLPKDAPTYRPATIIYREAERMAEIVRKIGKITRYETKSYVGKSQILDIDKATSHDE